MAYTETSHGKRRPRPFRPDRAAKKPNPEVAALAAPHQDPHTGRFLPGNPGARLRQLAAIGRHSAESLLRLDTQSVAPFLRPHLDDAQGYVQEIIDGLPAHTPELIALCADEAKARLLASAATTEGARESCTPDEARAWRDEARSWMREVRQVVLTRKALCRDVTPDETSDPHAELARIHEAERRERERRAALPPHTGETTQ